MLPKFIKNNSFELFLFVFVIVFFGSITYGILINTKETYSESPIGTERGVRIEVLLKGGGSAILVCPKFNKQPIGSHGRECYLEEYDSRVKD